LDEEWEYETFTKYAAVSGLNPVNDFVRIEGKLEAQLDMKVHELERNGWEVIDKKLVEEAHGMYYSSSLTEIRARAASRANTLPRSGTAQRGTPPSPDDSSS
jgi:hypothetical protein